MDFTFYVHHRTCFIVLSHLAQSAIQSNKRRNSPPTTAFSEYFDAYPQTSTPSTVSPKSHRTSSHPAQLSSAKVPPHPETSAATQISQAAIDGSGLNSKALSPVPALRFPSSQAAARRSDLFEFGGFVRMWVKAETMLGEALWSEVLGKVEHGMNTQFCGSD